MKIAKYTMTDKVRIFKTLFSGLQNVYGTWDVGTGKVHQVKEPVTDQVIYQHLAGRQSYGVYLLVGDKTRALAVDFDRLQLSLPLAFVAGAKRFGIRCYIERSKTKGFHVWMFFEQAVPARKARLAARKILSDMGQSGTEIFPKQDRLDSGIFYGNFINTPLFGALTPKGKTVFVELTEPTKVCKDQWELLETIERVPEVRLDGIIKTCHLDDAKKDSIPSVEVDRDNSEQKSRWLGLAPCARRILREGVSSYQRVICFRLAIHLKRVGIPYDLALAALNTWAQKNKPSNGKRCITDHEIHRQTRDAYDSHYRSFGCEDDMIKQFCHRTCPLLKYQNDVRGTNCRKARTDRTN